MAYSKIHVLILVFILLLVGCQVVSEKGNALLNSDNNVHWFRGTAFDHLMVTRLKPDYHSALHVYIEGDGRPWVQNKYIADNPDPSYPLALHLMAMDSESSLYLGRPCYFRSLDRDQQAGGKPCDPYYWTHGRYSEKVVASMVSALEAFLLDVPASQVTVIGYSGGGTIAYLMAARTDKINRVVTVAGNMDIRRWCDHHRFSQLEGSNNPADMDLPGRVQQLHLIGARDRNVPATISRDFASNKNKNFVVFPNFDHRCCWERDWQVITQQYLLVDSPKN